MEEIWILKFEFLVQTGADLLSIGRWMMSRSCLSAKRKKGWTSKKAKEILHLEEILKKQSVLEIYYSSPQA